MTSNPFDEDPCNEDPCDEDRLDDMGVGRAPICGACGVTALPAEGSNVLDTAFVCDNEGCEAFGEVVPS